MNNTKTKTQETENNHILPGRNINGTSFWTKNEDKLLIQFVAAGISVNHMIKNNQFNRSPAAIYGRIKRLKIEGFLPGLQDKKTKETKAVILERLPTPEETVCDEIYTLEGVAKLLKCNKRILAQKFRNGEIKGYKKLNRWYTLHSHVINFLTN